MTVVMRQGGFAVGIAVLGAVLHGKESGDQLRLAVLGGGSGISGGAGRGARLAARSSERVKKVAAPKLRRGPPPLR